MSDVTQSFWLIRVLRITCFEKGTFSSFPGTLTRHFEVIRKFTKAFHFNSCKAKTGNTGVCIILIEKKKFLSALW